LQARLSLRLDVHSVASFLSPIPPQYTNVSVDIWSVLYTIEQRWRCQFRQSNFQWVVDRTILTTCSIESLPLIVPACFQFGEVSRQLLHALKCSRAEGIRLGYCVDLHEEGYLVSADKRFNIRCEAPLCGEAFKSLLVHSTAFETNYEGIRRWLSLLNPTMPSPTHTLFYCGWQGKGRANVDCSCLLDWRLVCLVPAGMQNAPRRRLLPAPTCTDGPWWTNSFDGQVGLCLVETRPLPPLTCYVLTVLLLCSAAQFLALLKPFLETVGGKGKERGWPSQ